MKSVTKDHVSPVFKCSGNLTLHYSLFYFVLNDENAVFDKQSLFVVDIQLKCQGFWHRYVGERSRKSVRLWCL